MQVHDHREELQQQREHVLRRAVDSHEPAAIRDALSSIAPADLAELLQDLEDEQALLAFSQLDEQRRSEVLAYLDQHTAEQILSRLDRRTAAHVLDLMPPDDRARFFKHLPEDMQDDLFPLLAQAERNDLRRLLACAEGSAGSVMSTDYASVPAHITAEQAIAHLRRIAPHSETVYTVFVTDEQRRLRGVVSLLDLIRSPPRRPVRDIARSDVVAVSIDDDREEAAQTVAKYDLLAVPVVNEDGQLVGIITHDDAMDVLQAEQAEDLERVAGLAPDETPYDQASIGQLFRRRVPWLVGLMFMGLLAATVVAAFEEALTAAVALAFFIPVVTGSGGNTGTQSATLIIRAMTTGSVGPADWLRVFAKELMVGAVLGTAMAAVIFAIGLVWPDARAIAPVVGATMIALVIWANLLGALMPILLERLGIDPAVASAPLVATLIDATGLLIYFSVGSLLLPGV